jgi:hypothetical protein
MNRHAQAQTRFHFTARHYSSKDAKIDNVAQWGDLWNRSEQWHAAAAAALRANVRQFWKYLAILERI